MSKDKTKTSFTFYIFIEHEKDQSNTGLAPLSFQWCILIKMFPAKKWHLLQLGCEALETYCSQQCCTDSSTQYLNMGVY